MEIDQILYTIHIDMMLVGIFMHTWPFNSMKSKVRFSDNPCSNCVNCSAIYCNMQFLFFEFNYSCLVTIETQVNLETKVASVDSL